MALVKVADLWRMRGLLSVGVDDLPWPRRTSVTPALATLIVRRVWRRALVMVLLGLVVLVTWIVGVNAIETSAEQLAATGARTEGVVVDVLPRSRVDSGSITVRFTVDGVERERSINLDDTSPAFHPGDPVTVIYDPNDPERIATPETHNDPTWVTILLVIGIVLSLVLLPAGTISLVRWSRRLRSVRRHGWRHCRAYIDDATWSHSYLTITCGDDTRTVVTTLPVVMPIPVNFSRSTVYLGGAGKHLTVLLLTIPIILSAKPIDAER